MPSLRSILIALFVAVLATGVALAGESDVESIADESFKLDTGRFEGRVVYLDFWASWCKPCRRSFRWMGRMHEEYGDEGLIVIAVGLDSDAAEAARFLERANPPFRVVMDPGAKMAAAYDLGGMPCSFLFDRSGNLKAWHIGFRESDRRELERHIRAALEATPAPVSGGRETGAPK